MKKYLIATLVMFLLSAHAEAGIFGRIREKRAAKSGACASGSCSAGSARATGAAPRGAVPLKYSVAVAPTFSGGCASGKCALPPK